MLTMADLFSIPNNSESTFSCGIVARFTATKGFCLRSPRSCTALATSSLPVPLSPVIKTVRSLLTTRATALKISCIERERPTSGPPSSNCAGIWFLGASEEPEITSSARATTSTKFRNSKGFGRYSNTPICWALTAVSNVDRALMTITGRSGRFSLIRGSKSSASPSGKATSVIRTSPLPDSINFHSPDALPLECTV